MKTAIDLPQYLRKLMQEREELKARARAKDTATLAQEISLLQQGIELFKEGDIYLTNEVNRQRQLQSIPPSRVMRLKK